MATCSFALLPGRRLNFLQSAWGESEGHIAMGKHSCQNVLDAKHLWKDKVVRCAFAWTIGLFRESRQIAREWGHCQPLAVSVRSPPTTLTLPGLFGAWNSLVKSYSTGQVKQMPPTFFWTFQPSLFEESSTGAFGNREYLIEYNHSGWDWIEFSLAETSPDSHRY